MICTCRKKTILVACLLFLFGGSSAPAIEGDEGVEIAAKALRRTRQPWYDAEKDAVRAFERETVTENPTRNNWQGQAGPDWDFNWNWNAPDFSLFGEILRVLGWIALISLIAVLLYVLARTFMNVESYGVGAAAALADDELERERIRIENLPIDVTAGSGDFLELARKCHEAGNYGEAIIYLFSHQLLQLDRAGHIRLTKGKTNRQYLGEIRHARDLQRILGQTMVAFEEVFFGKHVLSRERFERCWQRNDQFSTLAKQVPQ